MIRISDLLKEYASKPGALTSRFSRMRRRIKSVDHLHGRNSFTPEQMEAVRRASKAPISHRRDNDSI